MFIPISLVSVSKLTMEFRQVLGRMVLLPCSWAAQFWRCELVGSMLYEKYVLLFRGEAKVRPAVVGHMGKRIGMNLSLL